MYILLESYYNSYYILNELFKNTNFSEYLIENLETNNSDFNIFRKHNPSVFFYAKIGVLFKKYLESFNHFSSTVSYKKNCFPSIVNENGEKFEQTPSTIETKALSKKETKIVAKLYNFGSAFIMSKSKKLDINFLSLFSFNEINSTRVVYNFFINTLKMNFEMNFYQKLIENVLISENLIFDLLYFSQQSECKIFDIKNYYEARNYGSIFSSNNYSEEDIFSIDQMQLLNSLKQNNINLNKEKIELIRKLFHDKIYVILVKAVKQNYTNLSNYIYMKVLNYNFDFEKII